jgi:hypothetical protein
VSFAPKNTSNIEVACRAVFTYWPSKWSSFPELDCVRFNLQQDSFSSFFFPCPLIPYWNVNGYYVGIGMAMVTMWILECKWLLCWDWKGNGYYVGIGMAMVTMLGLEWQWLLCGYWNGNGYYVEESSTFKVLIPLLFKKDKFDVQPSTPSVFSIPPIIVYCHFVVLCLYFCLFVLSYFSPSLVLFGFVFIVG